MKRHSFQDIFSRPKNDRPSRARSLVPRADSCSMLLGRKQSTGWEGTTFPEGVVEGSKQF